MNILLATHNFLPYHLGGTEIYVLNLAHFLTKNGHKITIIAAIDSNSIIQNPIIYEDNSLKICSYLNDGLTILGVLYKQQSTEQIYSKNSPPHKESFGLFFNNNNNSFDILHINGFTATIGLDLIYALKEKTPKIRIISSFHTAISDPKETLTFANTFSEQREKINPIADILSYRFNLPYWLAIILFKLLPTSNSHSLKALFNIRYLINQNIKSFELLKKETNEWWVYSNGIKNHLIAKGVKENIIKFERHGISPLFIGGSKLSNGPVKFLFSGRALRIKGFHTLLKAWLDLPENNGRQLWITGSPNLLDSSTKKLLKENESRNDIKWLGILNPEQLANVTLQVDTVIIPSECYEIGPLVFHEAIASGCNVIASDIGGCKELTTHYYPQAINFKTGDHNDLKSKIIKLQNIKLPRAINRPIVFNTHFEHLLEQSVCYG